MLASALLFFDLIRTFAFFFCVANFCEVVCEVFLCFLFFYIGIVVTRDLFRSLTPTQWPCLRGPVPVASAQRGFVSPGLDDQDFKVLKLWSLNPMRFVPTVTTSL